MKKLLYMFLLVSMASSIPTDAHAEQWGEIRSPETIVNIRAERNTHSAVVGKLYPGNRVRVDFLKDDWYAVFGLKDAERDEASAMGYAAARFLTPVDDSSNIIKPETHGAVDNFSANIRDNYCTLEISQNIKALKKLIPRLSKISALQTGDLPEMIARKAIRVLTPYSKTHYYVVDGKSHGFEYSLLKEYGRYLNDSYGIDEIGISLEFIPLPEGHIVQSLLDGIGDIAVTGAALPSRHSSEIALTEPYLDGIGEVVVTHGPSNKINSISDLAGKQFYLRPSGEYFKTIGKMNALLTGRNLKPVRVVKAEAILNAEDILELIDSGIIESSIVESHMASLWTPIFSNISVFEKIPVSRNHSLSFAVRKRNPKLKASLDEFLNSHRTGTLLGNIFFRRYFSDASRLKNPLDDVDRQRFSNYAPLFEKYGKLYGFDWMLLAALAYQESGLDSSKVSPAGAVGLMQLLPTTAEDHRIRIKNIKDDEANVHAGTKYLALLRDGYFSDPELDPAVRTRFALAAYNAGPGNIIRSRKIASETGYDPDRWFGHTEHAALRVIGPETVRYVGNINKYYLAYSLSGTLDCLKERQIRKLMSTR